MRAGLLADLILGENQELKSLINRFNFIILNSYGKITGFNHHMLRNFGKSENELMNQNFFVLFDAENGNADLAFRIKSALNGKPGPLSFSLPEQSLLFKGVALPVYDDSPRPKHLVILCREEQIRMSDEEAMEHFWTSTSEFLAQHGILTAIEDEQPDMKKPRILLIEDQKGLVVKIFSRLLKSNSGNVMLAPTAEAGLLMAGEFKPHAVVSTYEPGGGSSALELREKMNALCKASTILVSTTGGEIRIEDGWLDIHVKNQAESVSKIMDLINQIYID